MQRLNIPLSSHRRTTRRNRRVVWVLAAFLLVSAILTSRASTLWLSRTTIFAAAPDNTVAAIQLILNKRTLEHQLNLLGNIPLISNRSLTIKDLTPYTHGEIGWFFTESGSHMVAVRSSDDLPEELLKNYGVTQKRVNSTVLLLSESLVSVSGMEERTIIHVFPSLSKQLGQISFPSTDIDGSLVIKGDQYRILFNKGIKTKNEVRVMTDTALSLSTPELPKQVMEQMNSLVKGIVPIGNDSLVSDVVSMFSGNLSYLLNTSDSGNSYVIHGQIDDQVDVPTLIQEISAQNSPSIEQTQLQDGTTMETLHSDPDLISLEEVSVDGNTILRSDTLYTHENTGYLTVSDNQEMLTRWITEPEGDQIDLGNCSANILYLNPARLLSQAQTQSMSGSVGIFSSLLSRFSHVSVETKKDSTVIRLCSE
ncbi:hypothetical protein HOI18_03465 [Candidatus Uhrbacteria bacterium]|jgi:hypothetical protein|nr:hypothetical protein [Candidatus Uhrbacteria bacterium]